MLHKVASGYPKPNKNLIKFLQLEKIMPQEEQKNKVSFSLKFNDKEIEEMTPEHFKHIIKAFYDQVKDVVEPEEFVALGTALAVRKIKKIGREANRIEIKKRIREAINETK